MSALALGFMLAVCGFVWGGFVCFLVRALSHEKAKAAGGSAAGSARR